MNSDLLKGAIALPLTIALLALLVLAFQASPDKAVIFFGSFTAAIVAAGAVVGGALYQSHLTTQREDRSRAQLNNERALFIYSAMRSALTQIELAERLFAKREIKVKEGATEAPDDKADISAGTIRHIIPEFRGMNFDQIMNAGLSYPPVVALEISRVAFNTSVAYYVCRCPDTKDDGHISRQALGNIKNIINRARKSLEEVISQMEGVLRDRGVLS